MLIFIVVLCFAVACVACWLLFFPDSRESWQRSGLVRAARARKAATQWRTRHSATAARSSRGFLGAAWAGLKDHAHIATLAGLLVLTPPLMAWVFSGKGMLDGFEDSRRDANVQVSELLKGEQLVPPPALPPEIFAAAEVSQERPNLVSASRNWALLSDDYAQRLLRVFKIMKETHGYDMAILEGYRSPERQDMLASLGSNVTNAAAFQSYHQFGLAADCAFVRDGRLVISEKDPWAMKGYALYGEVAESMGLTWGGRWKMMDFGHTELRKPGVMAKGQRASAAR